MYRIALLCLALVAAATVRADQVIFSEVMYHPPDGKPEFIEVWNMSNSPRDIAKWRFTDGVSYTFPDFSAGAPQAHFLQAMERIVISSADEPTTRAAYPAIPANVRVYGSWTGALDSGGEKITLEDKNGVVICTLQYKDGGRWPKAADGAGHSLVLRNENNPIDDWHNWRQSKFTGGTPGYAEITSVAPYAGNPDIVGASVTAFDYNKVWKYFAPGATNPGTAWYGTNFNDSGWGAGPGFFGFETAVLPTPGIRTPVGATNGGMVYLFRTTFNFTGNPVGATYTFDHVLDDGVYYYLNGQPLGGHHFVPNGQWDAPADFTVSDAVEELNVITGPMPSLVSGVNVLAAEVHQINSGSSDMVFGSRLKINTTATVSINEVKPGAAGQGFVEFYNSTAAPIDLNGYYVSDTPGNLTKYQITTSLVVPGNSYATIGFAESSLAVNGGVTTIYLTQPNGTSVVNAISATIPLDGRSLGRNPAGSATWFVFAFPTPLAPNGSITETGFNLRLSEAHFDGNGHVDWVELQNTASVPVGVGGLFLTSQIDFANKIPLVGNVPGSGYASWPTDFATDASGDVTVYLVDSSNNVLGVAELERVPGRESLQAVYPPAVTVKPSWQSVPEQPWWHSSPTHTKDAVNAPPIVNDIVINEIMPDPPSDHINAEFIELYNKGASPVPMGGWKIRGGVEYDFPPGTTIAPGGYLVIGGDATYLTAAYPTATVLGNWSGKLGNGGDLIRVVDQYGNLADEVDYRIGGDWPDLAAGLGSSLELVHPEADNSRPSAWRDSDETNKTSYQNYTITGPWSQLTTAGALTDYRELHLFLVGDSHLALRNFNLVVSGGGTNLIPNGGATISIDGTSASAWLCQGTHGASYMQGSELHLVADGHGDNRPNRAEIDVTGMVPGQNHTLTFQARWVGGKNRLLVQTWDHSFGASLILPIPNNLGTAGAANSRLAATPPPLVDSVLHSPAVPRSTDPVKVTARVTSALPIAQVECIHRIDDINNLGTWVNTIMLDNGTNGDAVAGDGIYTTTITSHLVDQRIVQFYVRATAQGGAMREGPKLGAARPALWMVDNRNIANNLRRQRFVISQYDRDIFSSSGDAPTAKYGYRYPRLSNHYASCTFISNESDVYYNSEIRKSGSPWTRSSASDLSRGKWKVPRDRVFRGREKSTYDNDPSPTNLRFHNRIVRYWLYVLGHPGNDSEFVYNIINGDGVALREDTEPVDGEFVARVFPDGGKGQLYRSDDEWWFDDAWGRSSRNADWSYKFTNETIRYHTEWMARSREAEYDYSALIDFFRTVSSTSLTATEYQERVTRMLDPEMTLMMAAVRGYIHDWDSLTLDRGKNGYFYRKPTDGRFIFCHWDSDLGFDNASAGVVGGLAGWANYINRPWTRRTFNYYLTEMLNLTTGANAARSVAWLDAEEASTSAYTVDKSFYTTWFTNRQSIILNEINAAAGGGTGGAYSTPFAVTTPSSSTSAAAINLTGTAPSSAFTMVVDNHPEAIFTWTNQTSWTLSGLLLAQGVNTFSLRMLDLKGNTVGSPINFNFTKTNNAAPAMRLAADPSSWNVELGQTLTLDAGASFDPEAGALNFAWSNFPTSGVIVTPVSNSKRTAVFTVPGLYNFTVTGMDPNSLTTPLTREVTVFNSEDFESFGNKFLAPFWTLRNLELRDGYSPSAWYSLEDQPGRILIQTLADTAKPLVFTAPVYPALVRPLPASANFVLQTDLAYDTARTGTSFTGLQVDVVESGATVRYAFGVEGGTNWWVKRGTSIAAFPTLNPNTLFTGTEAVLRIRRNGSSLVFDRRSGDVWVPVWTQNIPVGSTMVNGGPFVATSTAESTRIAFDYVLMIDPANTNSVLNNLRITEVMYAPKAPDTVEFIELQNIGAGTINLQGCRFVQGDPFDEFIFPNLTLASGERCVVTNSATNFVARYGPSITVAGEWGLSSGLNNSGEKIHLVDADGNDVHNFTYSNAAPWPTTANGQGPSIEVVDLGGNYANGANWRASYEFGGSPGAPGAGPDTDGDGQPDSHEALFGTSPTDASSRFRATVLPGGQSQISFPSVFGRQYRVYYRDSLTTGDWIILQTTTATGTNTTITDTTTPKPLVRFYHVQAL